MKAWMYAMELMENGQAKVCLQITVDDVRSWKEVFVKDELIDIEVSLSHKE